MMVMVMIHILKCLPLFHLFLMCKQPTQKQLKDFQKSQLGTLGLALVKEEDTTQENTQPTPKKSVNFSLAAKSSQDNRLQKVLKPSSCANIQPTADSNNEDNNQSDKSLGMLAAPLKSSLKKSSLRASANILKPDSELSKRIAALKYGTQLKAAKAGRSRLPTLSSSATRSSTEDFRQKMRAKRALREKQRQQQQSQFAAIR